jgi:hypothetical protein
MIGSNSNIKLVVFGDDGGEAETEARNQSILQNKIYISPYNDIDVVCGQVRINNSNILSMPFDLSLVHQICIGIYA